MLSPIAFIILLLSITGCSVTSEAVVPDTPVPYSIHDGIVSYPDNLYFPSRVTLTINMYGVSGTDQENTLIVSQQIKNPQRFPVNYTLRYLSDETDNFSSLLLEYKLTREGENTPFLTSSIKDIAPNELDITRRTTLQNIR